jgi:hypothetical protein
VEESSILAGEVCSDGPNEGNYIEMGKVVVDGYLRIVYVS